jgi:hypothetical protein
MEILQKNVALDVRLVKMILHVKYVNLVILKELSIRNVHAKKNITMIKNKTNVKLVKKNAELVKMEKNVYSYITVNHNVINVRSRMIIA